MYRRALIPFSSCSSCSSHTFHASTDGSRRVRLNRSTGCPLWWGQSGSKVTAALPWAQMEGYCAWGKADPSWRELTAICHNIVIWLIYKFMITVDVNGAPHDPGWQKKNGAPPSSVRWEPLKCFVLLTTNSPSYIDIHFDYAIKFATIYLWAGQLAQH